MRRAVRTKALAIFLVGMSQSAWADGETWPRLERKSVSSLCSQALEIAKSTYNSDNFHLYEAPTLPRGINSRLVLQPPGSNISEGEALVADSSVFEQRLGRSGWIYWQTKASQGLRYVIAEERFGWRGSQYALFVVKDDVTPDELAVGDTTSTQRPAFAPLIGEGWRPPLIMQENSSGQIWAIDVGAPSTFLSDWKIYSIGAAGAEQSCTIHFRPVAETAEALLPVSVRKLAKRLDGTLGSGQNEGTLNQTGRIRMEVGHMWANIAMRPWAALKAQSYNDRDQVEAGLKKWARSAKSFGKIYQEISKQYPNAEDALARYYKARFHKKTDEARSVAKQALDIAFKSYFVFPSSHSFLD
jgi:hypothetical protein